MAIISPGSTSEIEALERDDFEVGDLEDLDEVVAHDERALAEPLPCSRGPSLRHRHLRRLGPRRRIRRRRLAREVDDLTLGVARGVSHPHILARHSIPDRIARAGSARRWAQAASPTPTATIARRTAVSSASRPASTASAGSPLDPVKAGGRARAARPMQPPRRGRVLRRPPRGRAACARRSRAG